MMELERKHFSEYPRESLKVLLDEKIASKTTQMTDINLYGEDGVRLHGMKAADLTTLYSLRYILVDHEGFKPWVIRKSLKRVIDLKDFEDYTAKLITWLCASPPYDSLGKAVHIHQIIRNLTTMELV